MRKSGDPASLMVITRQRFHDQSLKHPSKGSFEVRSERRRCLLGGEKVRIVRMSRMSEEYR